MASMVADCGGGFSPKILCCCLLIAGRTTGVWLVTEDGVVASLSVGLESTKLSLLLSAKLSLLESAKLSLLLAPGVEGRVVRSGDFVGDGGLDC